MSDLRCLTPWTDFGFNSLGVGLVNCCLYKGMPFSVPTHTPFDLKALWHSDWYADLRRAYRRQELDASGCAGCHMLQPARVYDPLPSDELNPAQRRNYEQAIQASRECRTRVEHMPAFYSVEFTTACNLRCIMCAQHDTRDAAAAAGDDDVSCDALMAHEEAFALADRFRVSGGEPLMSREAIRFIGHMARRPLLANVQLHLISNGIFLDRVLSDLEHVRRLRLNVSIDAVGEAYGLIRRGGSWKRLAENIDALVAIRDRLGKSMWRIQASMVIMKSSVNGIVEFTDWCLARDLTPVYQPLSYTRQTLDQDLLHNRALLNDLPHWHRDLLLVEEKLAKAGHDRQRGCLARFRRSLENGGSEKAGDGGYGLADGSDWLDRESGRGARVALWGTGSNYRYVWSGWLRENREAFDVVGFLDNDEAKWGDRLDGLDIRGPQALDGDWRDLEAIVMAMTPRLRADVIAQLQGMGFKGVII